MTYSIVARDPVTAELGVAAQSCYFALGSVLPWARAGVGAVATQSMVDPGYGPRCLELLASGVGASAALERVRAADPDHEVRQVALVDSLGAVAAFTGAACIDAVGHVHGPGFSTQANMMAGPGVCEAMAEAFEAHHGTLAARLVAALVAAQGAGGDARGQMSAALRVVDGERHDAPWEGIMVDVRVDHADEPLEELARLVRIAEAYHLCDIAEEALLQGDAAVALASTEAGLDLLGTDGNLRLSHLAALLALGRLDQAAADLAALVQQGPGWEAIARAMTGAGHIALPDGVTIDGLLARTRT